jgi:hypothetical protein
VPRLGEAEPDVETLHARRMRAMELRKKGKSYTKIGEELGISRTQAYHDVHYRLNQIIQEESESTEELRQLELDRLDALLDGIWDSAASGNLDAIDTALKIMVRRARYTGIDAAKKVEDVSKPRYTPEQLYERVRALHERLAAAGVKNHPILNERNPFEALKGVERPVLEGVKVPEPEALKDHSGE